MGLHNAPVHIEEHANVFTEKGYITPNVHVKTAKITNIACLDSIDKITTSDTYHYVINVMFEALIDWEPTLKL
jgi:hypothetical protein